MAVLGLLWLIVLMQVIFICYNVAANVRFLKLRRDDNNNLIIFGDSAKAITISEHQITLQRGHAQSSHKRNRFIEGKHSCYPNSVKTLKMLAICCSDVELNAGPESKQTK